MYFFFLRFPSVLVFKVFLTLFRWPCLIVTKSKHNKGSKYLVIYYGDNSFSYISDSSKDSKLVPFSTDISKLKPINQEAFDYALLMLPDKPREEEGGEGEPEQQKVENGAGLPTEANVDVVMRSGEINVVDSDSAISIPEDIRELLEYRAPTVEMDVLEVSRPTITAEETKDIPPAAKEVPVEVESLPQQQEMDSAEILPIADSHSPNFQEASGVMEAPYCGDVTMYRAPEAINMY
jgi:hypothetical protein